MRGFTLIELLITVAILVAIAAVGGINLFSYYSRQNLELTTEEIIALIRDAQNRSLTQQDGNADGQGDQWGIHFENGTSTPDLVRLFCCGPSYASGTIVSAHNLRIGIQLTDPSEGNSKDIIFSRLTGYPNASTSIAVALKSTPSASFFITVSEIGQVARLAGRIVTVPTAPAGLMASAGNQQVILYWNAPADDGGSTITNYKIYRGTSPGGESLLTTVGVILTYTDSGLTNGITYYYQVSAVNAEGEGPKSDEISATPGVAGPPGRYWVGGSGNWSDTAHWSAISGGAGGASVPTSNDDVYFDANSFTAAATTTINVAANAKNMNWTGVTNNPTLAGTTATLNIAGSLTLVSGMTRTYSGTITFSATSTGHTITLAGKSIDRVYFNGSGGWTLQDAYVSTDDINLTQGSLNTNGQSVTIRAFRSSGSITRSLTLGSSLITLSSIGTAWYFSTVTNLTFNAGTSQITLTGSSPAFSGGGLTYNNVILNSSGIVDILGANTFANLTRNGTAVTTNQLSLGANQTITGTLTLSGNSATNRLFVLSSVTGTARTLTAAVVSLTNVDFQDISGAGAASPFSGTSVGDALGNSNINFTAAVTRYWVGNGGSWDSTTKWSASSGGTSGASVPLPQDTAIFDANSFTSTGQIITANMPRWGRDINFTGVLNNPDINVSGSATMYGSLTLASGLNTSGSITLNLEARTSASLTSAGGIFDRPLNINAYNGTYTIQDTFNSIRTLTLTRGTLNTNNQNITTTIFSSSNSNTRTITMGSGTWTLTGTGTVWNTSTVTNLTLNANTSSVVINNNSATAKTFAGGGKTYYNFLFTNTGTGTSTISGSNIFNNFTVDTPPKKVNFTAGTTQTINGTFTANGSSGALMTFRSTASPTKWTVSAFSTNFSYVDVKDSTGSGTAAPFVCGATCVNSGNNTGWSF